MSKINIIVCIKQVPGTTDIKVDPETNTLVREGIESVVNPFDTYAIEEAISLKERLVESGISADDVNTIALSMGPPQATEVLREAISLGIDRAVLLSDRAFAGSDTWATAYTLAKAIKRIADYRIIIFGKQTMDGDTGQVGPEVSNILNMAFVGYASKVEKVSKKEIEIKRLTDQRYETFNMRLPIAFSVGKDINVPRIASLRGKVKAKNADIPVWDNSELELDEKDLGLNGSYTKVIKIFSPDIKHEVRMIEGAVEKQVEELYKQLKEFNAI